MHRQAIRREAFRLIDENRERLCHHHRPVCSPVSPRCRRAPSSGPAESAVNQTISTSGFLTGAMMATFDRAPGGVGTVYRALDFVDAGMPLT
jgi:hypothetical protein